MNYKVQAILTLAREAGFIERIALLSVQRSELSLAFGAHGVDILDYTWRPPDL